ncbi:MAG TPA: DUF4258 domain-containing protein [Thermoanaerobaculia bacterium]|nr:DUF4258 domain-containing protein [Thermoanaerobaculia bacterium]
MECQSVQWSGHSLRRMYERGLNRLHVFTVLHTGERIEEYPDDTPYPSCLLLGFIGNRPLHLVVAVDSTRGICYLVTVYEPDPNRWEPGFKLRRSS